jgi:hypothetical protein
MNASIRVRWLWLNLLGASPLAGCAAHAAPAVPAVPAAANAQTALPELPRSSIAAVVKRRAELGLTDQQVGEMERLDQQREAENAALSAALESKRKQAQAAGASGPLSSGSGAGGRGLRGGGMGGGGMRGGGRGMRGGPGPAGDKGNDRQPSLEDRFDENDTKAYLDAENVLEDAQKERAREIASDYREQLFQRREQARSAAKR